MRFVDTKLPFGTIKLPINAVLAHDSGGWQGCGRVSECATTSYVAPLPECYSARYFRYIQRRKLPILPFRTLWQLAFGKLYSKGDRWNRPKWSVRPVKARQVLDVALLLAEEPNNGHVSHVTARGVGTCDLSCK